MECKMEKEELMAQIDRAVGVLNRYRSGISLCDEAINCLAKNPVIVITGDYGDISLSDGEMGLGRKARADIAAQIQAVIVERRAVLQEEAESLLEKIFSQEPQGKCPYPPLPKAFGAVSADDVDL